MAKPYLTRKNLIALSLAFFYSILLVFTGLCLGGTLVNKNNPIASLGDMFNFTRITPGVSGFICLLLVALYIIVFVAVCIYERRYAIVNGQSPYSAKMFVSYFLSFVACLILSLGIGIVIQKPLTSKNIGILLQYIGQTFIITTLIYVILLILFGGVLLFVINFLLVDKPFRFFTDKDAAIIEDEEDLEALDVTANFDEAATLEGAGSEGSGAGGNGTGSGGGGAGGEGSVINKAEGLDDREKVFPALSKMDIQYEGYAIEEIETDDLTLEELCVRFRNYLAKEEKLYYDIETIRYYISGFGATHFMILEGLSGTGKSSLPRYFAKFAGCNLLFLPVQATWRDKTNLIGYFNDFAKTYSETEFLVGLYHGNYNPDMIHLYVLDEMNISRVEYYFADFLSVLEYPTSEWKLQIMQLPYEFIPPAKLLDGVIQIPENSYFVGTANKDDSTFTISDKVYDRVITIDFDNRNTPFEVNEDASPIRLSHSKLQSLISQAKAQTENHMTQADFDKLFKVTDYIYEQFDLTFGNRILNQINQIVPVYVACGGKKEEALDFLLSRKVISKLEGRFEEYVKGALRELLNLIQKTYGPNVLVRSEKEIQSLMRKL